MILQIVSGKAAQYGVVGAHANDPPVRDLSDEWLTESS